MGLILHITTWEKWTEAQMAGEYTAASLRTSGFIHCSKPSQAVRVADYLYRGRRDLMLLVIDEEKVIVPVKYEGTQGDNLFPHIYGALNVEAVLACVDFRCDAEGRFVLPAEIESWQEKGLLR